MTHRSQERVPSASEQAHLSKRCVLLLGRLFLPMLLVIWLGCLGVGAQNQSVVGVMGQVRQLLLTKHIDSPNSAVLDQGCLEGLKQVAPECVAPNGSAQWSTIVQILSSLQVSNPKLAGRAGETAIMRMAEAIKDPYTALLDRNDMAIDRLAMNTGQFTGIGVELAWKGGLVVVASIQNSPARAAGLRPGDYITAVDGKSTKGLSFYRAGDLLAGPVGSTAKLDLVRSGRAMSLAVVRRQLSMPGVESGVIADHIGYIKIGYFSPATGGQVAQSLAALKAQSIRGLILDLRGNPGGDFQQGLQVASLFRQGKLITVVTRDGVKHMKTSALPAFTGKIAVLTDKGTASSSEIVAQSLRGSSNVRIVGQRTFGKAVIQTLYSLPGGYGIRLTTGKYVGRNGKTVNVVGLKPDLVVEDSRAKEAALDWIRQPGK